MGDAPGYVAGYGDGPGTGGVLGMTRVSWRSMSNGTGAGVGGRPEPAGVAAVDPGLSGSGRASTPWSALAMAVADAKRRAGSFCKACMSTAERGSGMPRSGLTSRGSGGGVCRWWRMIPIAVSDSKGRRPVTIS
jgi:hypothetical protein